MFENVIGLKEKYRAGKQILGVGVSPSTPRDKLEATLDADDYDFVSIDSQHAPLHEERIVDFCGIAEEIGIFVQFRIKHTRHSYLVGNYLDLGPCGIEVPQTETGGTAEEAIHYFYYPPAGGRSFGGGARHNLAEFGNDYRSYAEWWNSFGVLWLQIESLNAVTNARMLARPGIDCLSFGPTDLSADLDSHPGSELKTVDECVAHTCRSLEGTGVAVCYRNGHPHTREKYADMGVTVFLESSQV